MKHYNNFRKQAQITYRVAIGCHGYAQEFETVLDGRNYIDAYLRGVVNGLIMAEIATTEEVRACFNYIDIVIKAYNKFYVEPKLHSK